MQICRSRQVPAIWAILGQIVTSHHITTPIVGLVAPIVHKQCRPRSSACTTGPYTFDESSRSSTHRSVHKPAKPAPSQYASGKNRQVALPRVGHYFVIITSHPSMPYSGSSTSSPSYGPRVSRDCRVHSVSSLTRGDTFMTLLVGVPRGARPSSLHADACSSSEHVAGV